jgi:hypothetical protein
VNLIARLLLAFAAALAALAPLAARAQDSSPLTLEVRAGYDGDGQFRVGNWFPLTVEVSNDGGDVRGTLELHFPGDGDGSFRYELDLPRGARKRITIPVVASESHGSATLSLSAEGGELARQVIRLDPITSEQLAVGVLSSDPATLNSLRAIQVDNGRSTAVTHLDPARLPDDAALLAGLDTIFVHDVATADLTGAQREALALWTRLGGELVVGGGPGAQRTVPGLADLLPVEVGELRPGVDAGSLAALAGGQGAPAPPDLTASAVTLRQGATDLDGAGLLTARDEGAGRVIFAAFDLAATRAWAGESTLWQNVLRPENRAQLGSSFRLRSENLLRDSLQLSALRLPSITVLLLLMLLYIVVVGPLNFWALRRARRVELAWVTTPLIVAVFLGAAYGASFMLRGTTAQISQLTIVQGFEGAEQGQATTFLGVFSPQRRSYALGFAPTTLVTPGTFESFAFRTAPVTSDGATTSMRDLLIDVSSVRTLMIEHPSAVAPAVESDVSAGQGQIRGRVTLTRGPVLENAQIVSGAAAQDLGSLRPGDSADFDFSTALQNFPDQVRYDNSGMFNRDRVLYSLFGYDRFSAGGPMFQGDKGIPEPGGVYLVGWADGADLGATIDGAAGRQAGETLYVIRLDVER